MQKNRDISVIINETLDAFEGIQKAEASPFFFAKLMNRMEEMTDKTFLSKVFLWISRPKVAMAILMIFLMLNAFFVFHLFTHKDDAVNDYAAIQQSAYLEFNNYQP